MIKTINGIEIEFDYKKINDKTIIFLHGFLGNLSSFNYYCQKFNNFGYSTLNINLTDYGFKNLPQNFTIHDYAQTVNYLIKSLKIKNYVLVGHSFGGRIATILSATLSENKLLVLVCPAGIKQKNNLMVKLKILRYKFCKFLAKKKLYSTKKLSNFGSNDYKLVPNNLKKVFQNIINEDLTYLFEKIRCPTLLFFGKKDKEIPYKMSKIFNKKIKNSKLITFESGHFCYLTEREKFIFNLKTFFKINNF